MITLSLWVIESVVWVSTPKMCRVHNVEYRSNVAAVNTQSNIKETGEDYSLVYWTGVGRRRIAMSFARVEGLKPGCTILSEVRSVTPSTPFNCMRPKMTSNDVLQM